MTLEAQEESPRNYCDEHPLAETTIQKIFVTGSPKLASGFASDPEGMFSRLFRLLMQPALAI
jgi:hypothetical protein